MFLVVFVCCGFLILFITVRRLFVTFFVGIGKFTLIDAVTLTGWTRRLGTVLTLVQRISQGDIVSSIQRCGRRRRRRRTTTGRPYADAHQAHNDQTDPHGEAKPPSLATDETEKSCM